jgi:hypothetical protein
MHNFSVTRPQFHEAWTWRERVAVAKIVHNTLYGQAALPSIDAGPGKAKFCGCEPTGNPNDARACALHLEGRIAA